MRALIPSAFLSSIALATVPAAAQSGDRLHERYHTVAEAARETSDHRERHQIGRAEPARGSQWRFLPVGQPDVELPTGSNQLTPQARETLDNWPRR